MKTLEFHQNEKKDRVIVSCADGEVSVYSHCAYCQHCRGIWVKKRMVPAPQSQVYSDIRKGVAPDENLMNAAMMFNTLIRDGSAVECEDDANHGFQNRHA
jgi:hypothetical protein